MATDERAWKDKVDGRVSVNCPKCKTVVRLQQGQAEDYEVIIICPECRTSFDYQRPS